MSILTRLRLKEIAICLFLTLSLQAAYGACMLSKLSKRIMITVWCPSPLCNDGVDVDAQVDGALFRIDLWWWSCGACCSRCSRLQSRSPPSPTLGCPFVLDTRPDISYAVNRLATRLASQLKGTRKHHSRQPPTSAPLHTSSCTTPLTLSSVRQSYHCTHGVTQPT